MRIVAAAYVTAGTKAMLLCVYEGKMKKEAATATMTTTTKKII